MARPGEDPLSRVGRWTGATAAAGSHDLPPAVREFLDRHVGAGAPVPVVPAEEWQVPDCRLSRRQREVLTLTVGPDAVSTERADRLAHAGGASYVDYLRRRAGEFPDAPDAVVRPADHDQTVALLQACSDADIAVVPVGGGTSVVGGTRATMPHIAVVLDRLGGLRDIDPVSCLARVGPAITGPRLEPLLAARGFTLGHLPQSWERATIGGYVATRSAGQSSSGYGRSDDMVESLTVATPQGTLRLGRTPSSAAGPDLRQLLVGSEGALGIITEVTLRLRHRPDSAVYEGVMFPSFAAGLEAFRHSAQNGVGADVMRLSDDAETRATLLMSGPSGARAAALERYLRLRGITGGVLAILGWEGIGKDRVRERRQATWRELKKSGAVSLGRRPGEAWRRGRFHGPVLRDELMDAGYLVETVESASSWTGLPDLHAAIDDSLRTSLRQPWVMAHVSHVYETGASVYTTVIDVADRDDPIGQWQRAKAAVNDALQAHGATITHHHAVGRDHAPWLPGEVGPLGIKALQAVKRSLDPAGILNPGALLADDAAVGEDTLVAEASG